ncbi:ABC transporter C-terminal domain-containing protein [Natrinema soli]|uniref:ABC transporter C-terminal domain-containing protein n=1 Tax=Natrinema soli TaxID=1930624 RepID=A0ABD5SVY9_9EURY|nr:ABC transporter C-terminal domain-containing protein [Natrinema soli]
MTGSTAVHRALECVDEEQEAIRDRGAAFETFAQRVRAVPAKHPGSTRLQRTVTEMSTTATQATPPQGSQGSIPSTSAGRCVTISRTFAETVRPHSVADCDADESLVETIAAELTEDVAVALVAESGWTPTLKSAVLEAVSTRRREVESLQGLLQRERSALETAIEEIDEIVDWLRATADESLLQCDFDALQAKHERLEAYRDRLEARIERRQAQFTESTNRYGPGGTRYRSVVTSVYSDLSVRYPLLSTGIRLYGICGGCQRAVRSQLTRRI